MADHVRHALPRNEEISKIYVGKITTAMFYRPGGQSTQNSGVAADVVIPSTLSRLSRFAFSY